MNANSVGMTSDTIIKSYKGAIDDPNKKLDDYQKRIKKGETLSASENLDMLAQMKKIESETGRAAALLDSLFKTIDKTIQRM